MKDTYQTTHRGVPVQWAFGDVKIGIKLFGESLREQSAKNVLWRMNQPNNNDYWLSGICRLRSDICHPMRYRDLIVWQKSMDLVEKVYTISSRFPKTETYGLTSQIRRAVVSIPSGIAEGQGRETDGDFVRFLLIANGSLREVETQLFLSTRLSYTTNDEIEPVIELCDEVAKLLNGLCKTINRRRT